MSLLEIKIVAILSILAVGVLGGLMPLLAGSHDKSRRFLSLGNALAGGVFLGAGFMHLLPEASEALEGAVDYPLAPLLAAVGVVLLLLIDRVLFEASHARSVDEKAGTRKPIYPLVLLIVLSIHSIIAGIALGLESDPTASLLVMVAILSHKGSAAFALMISVRSAGADRRHLIRTLATFAVMTPVGIVLGTIASGLFEGDVALLFEGSFNALAAGTFIYVAILDVLGAEMSRFDDRLAQFVRSSLLGEDDVSMPVDDTDRTYKFFLVVIGLAAMSLLATMDHGHSHGRGHAHDTGHVSRDDDRGHSGHGDHDDHGAERDHSDHADHGAERGHSDHADHGAERGRSDHDDHGGHGHSDHADHGAARGRSDHDDHGGHGHSDHADHGAERGHSGHDDHSGHGHGDGHL